MKNSSKNFKVLVAKMEALQETEQGKLKGGITVLDVNPSTEPPGTNLYQCYCTNGNCKRSPSGPTLSGS